MFKKYEWYFVHQDDHVESVKYKTLFGKEYEMDKGVIKTTMVGYEAQ